MLKEQNVCRSLGSANENSLYSKKTAKSKFSQAALERKVEADEKKAKTDKDKEQVHCYFNGRIK